MDESLIAAYLSTDYRVRLPQGGHASIRIGEPVPDALKAAVGGSDEPWVMITAWNPRSRRQSRPINRLAQRDLCKALKAAGARRLCVGIGVGTDGWREPALFATGVSLVAQEILMRRFEQNAIVRGSGDAPARLCLNSAPDTGPRGQQRT